jgi:beta-lactam-binding protein with PASTA domain
MATTSQPTLYGFFGLLWRMTLAAVILFGIAAVGGYVAAERLIRSPEAETPDLLTLDLKDAVSKSSAVGFPVMLEKREATDLLQEGKVLAQRPLPGTMAKTGAAIRLTIAAKP